MYACTASNRLHRFNEFKITHGHILLWFIPIDFSDGFGLLPILL